MLGTVRHRSGYEPTENGCCTPLQCSWSGFYGKHFGPDSVQGQGTDRTHESSSSSVLVVFVGSTRIGISFLGSWNALGGTDNEEGLFFVGIRATAHDLIITVRDRGKVGDRPA